MFRFHAIPIMQATMRSSVGRCAGNAFVNSEMVFGSKDASAPIRSFRMSLSSNGLVLPPACNFSYQTGRMRSSQRAANSSQSGCIPVPGSLRTCSNAERVSTSFWFSRKIADCWNASITFSISSSARRLRRDSKRLSAEDNRLRNSAIIRSELGEISRKSSTSGPSRCLKCSLIVSKSVSGSEVISFRKIQRGTLEVSVVQKNAQGCVAETRLTREITLALTLIYSR